MAGGLAALIMRGNILAEAETSLKTTDPPPEGGFVILQEAYIKAIPSVLTPKTVIVPKNGYGDGQCVSWVKHLSGLTYKGNAIAWSRYVNSDKPSVGSVVVLREGPFGHVAYVLEVYEDSFLVSEQNYLGLYIISERKIPNNYPPIVGFIHK